VGKVRVGFMSQISPDGRSVVSTFAGSSTDFPKTNYVRNFTDYRFLQVFYPTRGILAWYSKEVGRRQPLPGADDPRYVQTGGVWSPDGKYIVFARALARDPIDPTRPLANYATDPNETQIQYDLYRIPFNGGKGGRPERIVGASQNGMSNNFPKISPDGRWIVFVQCRNGEVMRPDSQLFIVPFEGGNARRLRANTSLMNSWHSFSPNGRWLVFSSKARSPYTQMYLTHIDAGGNSSPAILIDNTTASNRAVNLPEFVNIAGDGIDDIQIPAIRVYRFIEEALILEDQNNFDKAESIMRQAVTTAPENADFRNDLAAILLREGKTSEALNLAREAVLINPLLVNAHFNVGAALIQQGHPDQALSEFEKTLELNPRFLHGEEALATVYGLLGKQRDALIHWRKEIAASPDDVNALMNAARILASSSDDNLRNGSEAHVFAKRANELTAGSDPDVLDALAAAFAEAGQFPQAITSGRQALELAVAHNNSALSDGIRYRLGLYTAHKAFRAG
jgi:tetratricopeptide (TPR) repeat protein